MTQKFTNLQIALILETPLGSHYGAYAEDSAVEAARKKLVERYEELYFLDFNLASLSARLEFLQTVRPEAVDASRPTDHLNNPHRPEESLCGPVIYKIYSGPLIPILEFLDYKLPDGHIWCSQCTKRTYAGLTTAIRKSGRKLDNSEHSHVIEEIHKKLTKESWS